MKHFAGTPEEQKKHKDMIEDKFNIVKDIQNSIPKFPEMHCLAKNFDWMVFKRFARGMVYERQCIQKTFNETLDTDYILTRSKHPQQKK